MRQITLVLTVYFGLLSIAPNMEGIQLFKFGALLHHFQSHQDSQDQFESFADFVFSHYSSEHRTNSDERNLPFKTATSANLVLLHTSCIEAYNLSFLEIESIKKPSFYYTDNIPSKLVMSIWHPPKGFILSA